MVVWVVDFFKVKNPKLFAAITVALVALLGFLSESVNKGVVCSDWEKAVQADVYVTVTPGDSVDLSTFVPQDTIPGKWVNEEDGVFLANEGGISVWVYEKESGEVLTVATNTCFINDATGLLAKIMFWLTTIVTALVGVHTSDRKRELLAKRGK